MLLRYKLIIGMLLISIYGNCQYDPMSSLSMFNQMFYNPGYAGDGNEIEAKLLNRAQYMNMVGVDKNPNSTVVSLDAPFNLFNKKHGVGISILIDEVGFLKDQGINLSYAYKKSLIQGELGIGLGVNIFNSILDSPNWITGDVTAELDEKIPLATDKGPISFGLNLGVFYRADNLYFSVSARNISGPNVEWVAAEGVNPTYNVSPSYYISTGYDYQLPNPLFAFHPNVFLCTDFSVTQVNLVGKLTYNNRIFGGLGYRPWDAVWVLAGIDLPSGFEVAVSYDVQTSRMVKSTSGSFEFMLGYSFNLDIDKDARKYKSVRLL